MTYAIFEGNMERFKKKLTRIFNKCKAYGCDFLYEEVGETFKELKDDKGRSYTARFILIEAQGTAIMDNWEYIASCEHTQNGNILTGIPGAGVEVPERYYTENPVCEHCNSKRQRKFTYIVRNTETGEFKQVGKSCLNDFTHGMNAEVITRYMSLFDTLLEGEEPFTGCHIEHYLLKEEFLAYVAESIRHFGYIGRNDSGRCTASRAMDYYDAARGRAVTIGYLKQLEDEMASVNFDYESPETVQLVKVALEWVSNQTEDSNYIHNLKTVCSLEYVTYKNFGLLASLFPAYYRDLKRMEKRKAVTYVESDSKHVGEIKSRIQLKVAMIKCVTSWETDFGTTRIYKIIGEDGNVYTWKTGKFINTEEAINTSVTGTVKAHTEFKGVKQTELTRCRFTA